MNTRKTVFFCNLVIIALCVLSIVSYFTTPFWSVKAEYILTAESLQSSISSAETETEGEKTAQTLADGVDFTEIVGEDGISLRISLTLETADLLSALSAEPAVVVERILSDNVHNFVDEISGVLSEVIRTTTKLLIKSALKEGITVELHQVLGETLTDTETHAKLNAAGITDDYLNQKSTQLVNSLYSDGSTAETLTNSTLQIVEESIQKMKDSGNPDYANLEFSEENRADLAEELTEQFKTFENEDGTLNLENFTTDFIMEMFLGEENAENSAEETAGAVAKPLSAKTTLDTEEDEKADDIRELLTEKIMETLEGAEETIASIATIISYVILVNFIIWALPIVKILLKMNKPNNAIKLGLPIWFGSAPFVVLSLIPNLILSIFITPASTDGAMSGLSIAFSSCAIVSFIVGIALAVFVLFFYGKQRRILKRSAYIQKAATQE